MILDILLIIFFLYSVLIGYRRGLFFNFLHFFTTLTSFWIAYQFYKPIGERLLVFIPFPKTLAFDMDYAIPFTNLQQRFDSVVAFLMIALFVKLILYLIVSLFDKIIAYQNLKNWSRILGAFLGILSSILWSLLLIYTIALYPEVSIQESLSHSLISKSMLLNTPFISSFILNL